MTEAIDEYVMSHLTEFDDKKFQDASKDNLKLTKDDKKAAKVVKARPRSPSCHFALHCVMSFRVPGTLSWLKGAASQD